MEDNGQHRPHVNGPFGMGRQGYLVAAVVILVTALFAATRQGWPFILLSAITLPLVVFGVIHILTRLWWGRVEIRDRGQRAGNGMDFLSFLVLTNPFVFLLFAALHRNSADAHSHYQDLLRSGSFGMGRQGYGIALIIVLAPILLTIIIVVAMGGLPAHAGTHFP